MPSDILIQQHLHELYPDAPPVNGRFKNNPYLIKLWGNHNAVMDGLGMRNVVAPLTEQFGFTVGANYSTPFDTQNIGEQYQKIAAYAKVGQKFSFEMNKAFINAEPAEISFQMEFSAYYDGLYEVLLPIFALVDMALPAQLNSTALKERIDFVIDTLQRIVKAVPGFDQGEFFSIVQQKIGEIKEIRSDVGASAVHDALNFLSLLEAPGLVNVSFGNVYTITDAFISSISVQFSNLIDAHGIPLHATADITLLPKSVPTRESVSRWWSHGGTR